MASTCWDAMCGPDCAWCPYKQARYRQGFATPCWEWFRARGIAKNCRECRYYLGRRAADPSLPEDPAWRPETRRHEPKPPRASTCLSALLTAGALSLAGCLEGGRPAPHPSGVDEEDTAAWVPPTPLVPDTRGFPPMPATPENPLTEEGAALGEALFHDPILSLDSTISCASCHNPAHAFADRGRKVSLGVAGREGTMNSPPLFNLAWTGFLFWDGRAASLEEQALHPVPNEREMALPWSEAARRLASHRGYRAAFRKAFGGREIDSLLVVSALAQFQRTLISGGSRFDRWKAGSADFTAEEEQGYALFSSDATNCAACHNEPFFNHPAFANIGLDPAIEGTGRGGHTGIAMEMGKWKIPSLRNLAFTAPYMHDGRFATLDEVLDFYESGGHYTTTLDPLIRNPDNPYARFPGQKGLGLTEAERKALLAFLATLNDSAFAAAIPPRGP